MTPTPEARAERERLRKRTLYGQLLAYLLIVIVAACGFYAVTQTQNQMCNSAKENRVAIQNLTVGVQTLGLNLIIEGKPRDKWTPEEEAAVATVQKFKDEQDKLLDQPVC